MKDAQPCAIDISITMLARDLGSIKNAICDTAALLQGRMQDAQVRISVQIGTMCAKPTPVEQCAPERGQMQQTHGWCQSRSEGSNFSRG